MFELSDSVLLECGGRQFRVVPCDKYNGVVSVVDMSDNANIETLTLQYEHIDAICAGGDIIATSSNEHDKISLWKVSQRRNLGQFQVPDKISFCDRVVTIFDSSKSKISSMTISTNGLLTLFIVKDNCSENYLVTFNLEYIAYAVECYSSFSLDIVADKHCVLGFIDANIPINTSRLVVSNRILALVNLDTNSPIVNFWHIDTGDHLGTISPGIVDDCITNFYMNENMMLIEYRNSPPSLTRLSNGESIVLEKYIPLSCDSI